MYKSLKKIAKVLVPKKLLQKNELFFRKLISLKYKGNKHQCNICGFQLKHFVELEDKDLLCPRCGSRSRTRRLYKMLTKTNALNGTILHFSPPLSLSKKIKTLKTVNYYSSDFENEFIANYNFDITSIACETDFFDLIICYHVLEHIEKDTKAMSELYRVLKPNGICFIQTPFKDGDIYEDYNITTEEGRLAAFGQEDHVRIYSENGLTKRLETAGFEIDRSRFESDLYLGLKNETVIVAKKIN